MGIINMVPFPAFKPEPPVVVITTADNQYVDSAVFGIAGTASDPNDDIASVAYDVSGDGDSGACAGTTSWSATTDLGSVGTKTVTVTATDARSLTGDDSITVYFISISVDITTATEQVISGSSFGITGTASSVGDTISSVDYVLTGATSDSGACSGTTNWSKTLTGLGYGVTTITVTATGAHGHTKQDSITVERAYAPVVSITNPADDPHALAYTVSAHDVSGTASVTGSTISSVAYVLTGKTSDSGACSGTTSWSKSLTGLNHGTTLCTINATSAKGMVGSDTVSFNRAHAFAKISSYDPSPSRHMWFCGWSFLGDAFSIMLEVDDVEGSWKTNVGGEYANYYGGSAYLGEIDEPVDWYENPADKYTPPGGYKAWSLKVSGPYMKKVEVWVKGTLSGETDTAPIKIGSYVPD